MSLAGVYDERVRAGGKRHDAEQVAATILYTAPLVLRAVRRELRMGAPEGMSVPQFHALLFVRMNPGTGLSELADFLGATLPTMSELVNRLVAAGMLVREQNPAERRRIRLTLTAEGEAALDDTIARAKLAMAGYLAQLKPVEVERLGLAFGDLNRLLTP